MRITKLIFVQTGTYNDMVLRPYYSNLDNETLNQFQEATEGGANLTPMALAGVAGNMIKPKAQAEGVVHIPNGWREPRLRFMMEIQHEERMGTRNVQILCGYTDFVGATASGAIAPEMKLFFNSSILMRSTVLDSGFGRINRSVMAEASHVLTGVNSPSAQGGFGFSNPNFTYCMRPEDVFNAMETGNLGGDVMDLRSIVNNQQIKKSRRSNGVAPTYLAGIMQSFKGAVAESDMHSGISEFILNAKAQVRESLPAQDGFLSRAARLSQLNENGCITFGELADLDPNVYHVTVVNLIEAARRAELHQTGSTEHWHGSGMETVAATILCNSVPSLLLDLLMTRITFMTTNETYGGIFETRILEAKGFSDNVDLTPYVEQFIRRLEFEVLRDLTHNNNISVSVQMTVDILGDTFVSVSMNGQPAIDFVAPSFCDALTAPVLTQDQMTLKTVASDMEVLAGELAGTTSIPQPEQHPYAGGNNGFNSLV